MVIVPTRAQASRPPLPQALDVLAAVPVALLLLTPGARRSSISKHSGPSAGPARPLKARSTTSGPTPRSRDVPRGIGRDRTRAKATEAREAPADQHPNRRTHAPRSRSANRHRPAMRACDLSRPARPVSAAEPATGIVSGLADDAEKALGAALVSGAPPR